MWCNGIPIPELKTGVTEVDWKIDFLINTVGGDIERFLNVDGNISCTKIDEQKGEVLGGMDKRIVQVVEDNLSKVQEFFKIISRIGTRLNNCKDIAGCKIVLSQYNKEVASNNIILGILLSKCSSLDECEKFLFEYGNGVSLNINVIKVLLRKCQNIGKCFDMLKKYGNGTETDIEIINLLLSKCNSLGEIEKVISIYLGKKELDIESYITIFKVLVNDGSSNKGVMFKVLTGLLKILNGMELTDKEKNELNKGNNKNGNYYNTIKRIIRTCNLNNLDFLLFKL